MKTLTTALNLYNDNKSHDMIEKYSARKLFQTLTAEDISEILKYTLLVSSEHISTNLVHLSPIKNHISNLSRLNSQRI